MDLSINSTIQASTAMEDVPDPFSIKMVHKISEDYDEATVYLDANVDVADEDPYVQDNFQVDDI